MRQLGPPSVSRRLASLATAAAAATLAAVSPARSQQPASLNGPPVQVIPSYPEPGVPTVSVQVGTLNLGSFDAGSGSTAGGPGSDGASVATDYDAYLGKYVGTGQCVALVQAADPSVGLTATWTQGAAVQGNTSLQPGTIIATFGPNGTYTNSTDGSSHAAIYLGQNAQGIQVEDQWAGQAAHTRTIAWSDVNSSSAANNGSAFHVVSHAS